MLFTRRGLQFEPGRVHLEVFTFAEVHVHVWAWPCDRSHTGQTRTDAADVSAETSDAMAYSVTSVWAGHA
jgi:hypothetical protein